MAEKEIKTLKDLSKQRMLEDAVKAGKAEWFLELCEKYPKQKTVGRGDNKKQIDDIDLAAVRKEFCKEFYPELVKPSKPKKLTYLEQVRQAAEKEAAKSKRKAARTAKKETSKE